MPLFGWIAKKSKSEVDYKSKVEHKLLQAKQTPEPIFDLSDCNLKEVPPGVYAWCKVCLKEALLLQDNSLTSLHEGGNLGDLAQLQVLDLHNNEFRKLSPDIGNLTNLQVLYLNNNSLSYLPPTFKSLKKLKTLNISGNKFQEFPSVLCEFKQLRTLDISNNSITKLPPELAFIRTLDTLVLEANTMEYPVPEICTQGTEAIMRYLCTEINIDYIPPSKAIASCVEVDTSTSVMAAEYEQRLADYWAQLENQKEQKRKSLIAMEQSLQEHMHEQTVAVQEMQKKKLRLLDDVSKGQNQLQAELLQAQAKKDKVRQDLLSDLLQVEIESTKAIEALLDMAEKSRNVDEIMEAEGRERLEFEELFLKKQVQEELCKKEVLSAMTQMLQSDEMLHYKNAMRTEATKRLQQENESAAELLDRVLSKRSSEQANYVNQLLNQENVQKEALIALMSKRDEESVNLRDQVSLIQDELAKLSMLELKQRDLNIAFQQELLAQKREILTQLLVQVMEQQKQRREEMDRRLHEMEEQRVEDQADYWLIQYQRLMAHKPPTVIELEANMDPLVKTFLNRAGVSEYTALFARHKITYVQLCTMGKEQLKEIGLFNPLVINSILNTLEAIRQEKSSSSLTSDEESTTSEIPSAPHITAHAEVECVVCMESVSCILFLHCGHVCCCEKCAAELTSCPMCRGDIVQSFQLRFVD